MSRDEKIAKARELREAGWGYAQIADEIGVSQSSVYRWIGERQRSASTLVHPERECYVCGKTFKPTHGNQKVCCGENARKRFHENHRTASCSDCGAKLAAGTGYPGGKGRSGICATCHRFNEAERLEERTKQIVLWWHYGWSYGEIAREFGWSVSRLGGEIIRLREKGYDLPYRRAVYPTKTGEPRFPEQVPA